MKLYALMTRAIEAEECAAVDIKPAEGVTTSVKVEMVAVPHEHINYQKRQGWVVFCQDLDMIDLQIGEVRQADEQRWNRFSGFFKKG